MPGEQSVGPASMNAMIYHVLIACGVAVIVSTQFYPGMMPFDRRVLVFATLAFIASLVVAGMRLRRAPHDGRALAMLFVPEVLLVAVLIFCTGGVNSPFSLLLGFLLVVIGASDRVLLIIVLTTLACIAYLAAVYARAWVEHAWLSAYDLTHVQLQVFALMLVGGVMAAIARRHGAVREARWRAEQMQHQLAALHARVLEAMDEGVIVADEFLRPVEMNQAARQYLEGIGAADEREVIRRLVEEVEGLKAHIERGGGSGFQRECPLAGRSILLHVTHLPASELRARWLFTLVDLSSLRALERQLLEQRQMAMLGQMSAMVAHEIRNPIQSLTQGLELFLRVGDARRREIIEIMQHEVARLNRMVNGILDFARPLQPHPAWVQMDAFVQQLLQALPEDARRRIRWHGSCPRLYVDPEHLRMVVDNLLSNALSQRAQAPVELSLEGDAHHWRLRVRDHAGGIDPQLRERLFEPFVSGRVDGIGLGLATVKQVCEANGWHVTVHALSDGACFVVCGGEKSE